MLQQKKDKEIDSVTGETAEVGSEVKTEDKDDTENQVKLVKARS